MKPTTWMYVGAVILLLMAACGVGVGGFAVDDARQADNGIHAAHRDTVAFSQRGHRHQTHGNILEDITVIQGRRGFDAIIARLIVDGLVQVFPMVS